MFKLLLLALITLPFGVSAHADFLDKSDLHIYRAYLNDKKELINDICVANKNTPKGYHSCVGQVNRGDWNAFWKRTLSEWAIKNSPGTIEFKRNVDTVLSSRELTQDALPEHPLKGVLQNEFWNADWDGKHVEIQNQALKDANLNNQFPKKLSSKLKMALLTLNFNRFSLNSVTEYSDTIFACSQGSIDPDKVGQLADTRVQCESLGKNWRLPTVNELKENRSSLLAALPYKPGKDYPLQTSDCEFWNVNRRIDRMFQQYYNPFKDHVINENLDWFHTVFSGAKGRIFPTKTVCVCTSDCAIKN